MTTSDLFKRMAIGAGALALTTATTAQAETQHDAFTSLLQRYVHADGQGANMVDYAAWRASADDHMALKSYIKKLTSRDIYAIESRDAQFAAWANLYNAVTLDIVLDAYPVKSIRKIKSGLFSTGPWKKNVVEVAGRSLSLDDIEHGILRAEWSDPRVHYAVNCASIGCPDLQASAWEAETLDTALDDAARDYINHPRGVMVRVDGGLQVSSIYKWFQEDFGGDETGVLQHLSQYAQPDLAARIANGARIEAYAYDWALNNQTMKHAEAAR